MSRPAETPACAQCFSVPGRQAGDGKYDTQADLYADCLSAAVRAILAEAGRVDTSTC